VGKSISVTVCSHFLLEGTSCIRELFNQEMFKIMLFCNMSMRKVNITSHDIEDGVLAALRATEVSVCEFYSSGSITLETCCFPSIQRVIQEL
jgi:hypothetical protein